MLSLVRSALWKEPVDRRLFAGVDWVVVCRMAEEQGVLAIAFDGLQNMPHELLPDMDTLIEWFGQTEYMVTRYEEYKNVIRHLAHFYDEQGVKMMVLKGYGLSQNYPIPSHRPTGDIDTYNFGLWKFADKTLHEKLGIEIDNSHHHHTVFTFEGIPVENHYDFLNVHSKKSNVEWEKVLKFLVQDGMEMKDEEMENVYYPCPNFNALFIVRHSAGNFCARGQILRQLLDWLLFVRKYHNVVDWKSTYSFYRRFNLDRYVNSLNAIGVKYLGFDQTIFHEIEVDENLVDRVMNDILNPEFQVREDGTLWSGLWIKPRRWWHNRWKHKICSTDSIWSLFWHGVHAKLLKPAHFRQ